MRTLQCCNQTPACLLLLYTYLHLFIPGTLISLITQVVLREEKQKAAEKKGTAAYSTVLAACCTMPLTPSFKHTGEHPNGLCRVVNARILYT